MKLSSLLRLYSPTEESLRIIMIALVGWMVIRNSTLFEEEYNPKLMNLYTYPWWRFMMVFLVIASSLWAPELAIIVAMAIFFYLNDMNTLIQPIAHL